MQIGHLVKTNPNKANLVPSEVEGSVKTTPGFAGLNQLSAKNYELPTIFSFPPIYGRRTFGIVTEPSEFW